MSDADATRSPTSVVLAALQAHAAADWPRFAALLDERSLDEWREGYFDDARLRTIEEWRARFPKASEAWLARVTEIKAESGRQVIARLPQDFGVGTLAELDAMSSAEIFVRFVQRYYGDPDVVTRDTEGLWFRAVREEPRGPAEILVTVECLDGDTFGAAGVRVARRQPDGTWRVAAAGSVRLPC